MSNVKSLHVDLTLWPIFNELFDNSMIYRFCASGNKFA